METKPLVIDPPNTARQSDALLAHVDKIWEAEVEFAAAIRQDRRLFLTLVGGVFAAIAFKTFRSGSVRVAPNEVDSLAMSFVIVLVVVVLAVICRGIRQYSLIILIAAAELLLLGLWTIESVDAAFVVATSQGATIALITMTLVLFVSAALFLVRVRPPNATLRPRAARWYDKAWASIARLAGHCSDDPEQYEVASQRLRLKTEQVEIADQTLTDAKCVVFERRYKAAGTLLVRNLEARRDIRKARQLLVPAITLLVPIILLGMQIRAASPLCLIEFLKPTESLPDRPTNSTSAGRVSRLGDTHDFHHDRQAR